MNDGPVKPKRRWYQYSLRTLFVLTALVAVVLAYHKVCTQRYEAQQRAIAAIDMIGGATYVKHQPHWWQRLLGPAYYSIETARIEFVFPVLTSQVEDLHPEFVDRIRSAIDEMGQPMPSPLFAEPLGDAKLAALAVCLQDLPNVETIVLSGASSTTSLDWSMGEENYPEPNTEYFRCSGETQISDHGLRHLAAAGDVKQLVIRGDRITDDGLRHLEGLKNLRKLWLGCPQVTTEGVQRLQRTVPDCVIVYQ
jgi:hypothetical protein